MPTETADAAALEYFEAKLRYETTPFTLNYNLEKGKVFLIDPRDRADFETEHIPGSVSMPLAEIEKNAARLPKDKPIVAYGWHVACAFGPKACLALAKLGFRPQELLGGLEQWKKKFPTEKA
jgi:rhodanese-related sulfurtransferase